GCPAPPGQPDSRTTLRWLRRGLVTNLSRPGGNITGLSFGSALLQVRVPRQAHRFALPNGRPARAGGGILPPILSESREPQDYGNFLRCQIAPRKYSYMLGGMVSLCSLAMCLRTISEYKKRSPQMRQCHWSRPNI